MAEVYSLKNQKSSIKLEKSAELGWNQNYQTINVVNVSPLQTSVY
jgi:hypothetical protein